MKAGFACLVTVASSNSNARREGEEAQRILSPSAMWLLGLLELLGLLLDAAAITDEEGCDITVTTVVKLLLVSWLRGVLTDCE